jgi:hypothetical protein
MQTRQLGRIDQNMADALANQEADT